MQTKSLNYLTLRKLVMNKALKIPDPFVPDPSKAFSQYDNAPHTESSKNPCKRFEKIILFKKVILEKLNPAHVEWRYAKNIEGLYQELQNIQLLYNIFDNSILFPITVW